MSNRLLKKKAASLVAEAWALYFKTRDPQDERIAKLVTEAAAQPAAPRKKKNARPNRQAEKNRIRRRSTAIDPNAPILTQVRNLVE